MASFPDMFSALGNTWLFSQIKTVIQSGTYPKQETLAFMQKSWFEKGKPGLPYYQELQKLFEGYRTPTTPGEIATPLPPGYPANLPRPYYLPDERIVLKPVPVTFEQLSNADVGWIMVALQNAINMYSREPYPINWTVQNKGSGFGDIVACAEPPGADMIKNMFHFVFWRFHNFSKPPDVGGDPLGQMILSTVLSFIPGGKIVGNTLGLLSNALMDSTPVTNLPPPAPGTGSGNVAPGAAGAGDTEKPNYLLWGGIAAALLGIYVWYDSDS